MIFDSHFHIINPEFTCADYLARTKGLNIVGGTVVSASFQKFDQSYLLAALKILGPAFVGVTQLPASVSDEEIQKLNFGGVCGVRFNLVRGGSEKVENMVAFAQRIHDAVGWHVELYVDSKDLPQLSQMLLKLPAVSIDHLGLSREGFPTLLSLVEKGIKVKASGFGRGDLNVPKALKELVSVNPDAVMFGTDLPSVRAPRPFLDEDVHLILDAFDRTLSHKILYLNAIDFYRHG